MIAQKSQIAIAIAIRLHESLGIGLISRYTNIVILAKTDSLTKIRQALETHKTFYIIQVLHMRHVEAMDVLRKPWYVYRVIKGHHKTQNIRSANQLSIIQESRGNPQIRSPNLLPDHTD